MKKIFVLVGVMLAMGQSGVCGENNTAGIQPSTPPYVPPTTGRVEPTASANDAGDSFDPHGIMAVSTSNLSELQLQRDKSNCDAKLKCRSTKPPPAPPQSQSGTKVPTEVAPDAYKSSSEIYQNGKSSITQQQRYVEEVLKSSQSISADGVAQSKLAYAKTSQDILNKPQIDEAEVRKLQQDRALVNRAEESVFGKKKIDFTSEDAEKANFPLIRANLRVVGSANELNKTAGFEYARLGNLAAQFAGLSSKNKELSQKIGSNENQSIVGVIKTNDESSTQSNIGAKNDPKLALLGAEKKSKEDILKDIKKIKDAYLRDKLKKQLESDLKAMNGGKNLEEAVGSSFDGKIAFDSDSRKTSILTKNSSEEGSDAFEKNADTFKTAKPFTLDSPENDRKIASIVDEVRAVAGEFEQSGILEEDSKSLFVRVSSTYRECVARKCVRLR